MGDSEVPLLEPKWYDNCPGCELERRKIAANGAPKKELSFVALLVLCNALPISSLFPFIYFMVRDLHIAKSDKDIGFYAGYIGSSFMFGRFLTSTLWGMIADKYGRKPVFIIGTFSIVVFNTTFGWSVNFWMAIASRFLLGCFNGMLGPIRAYASEICSEENQALGLSMVGTFWGLGLIIGPALGGYLAQPSLKYPKLFPEGSLFDQFPYLLPCLCISAFAVLSLVVALKLPESLHKHPPARQGIVPEDSLEKICDGTQKHENNYRNELLDKQEKVHGERSIYRNRGLMVAIAVYCIWALHDMSYSEIFSLWAVSPSEYGGLGYSTSDVGVVLAVSGAVLLVFQLSLFPLLAKVFGPILVSRASSLLSIPLVAVYPLIARLHGTACWGALISASVLKNILSACVITASFLLINNSVVISQRGVANGISLTWMSLFKAIGPACAGAFFSWAQKRLHASFLPGNWMVFSVLDALCLITALMTFEPILPHHLNKPEPEVQDQDQCYRRSSHDQEHSLGVS